MTDEQRSLIGRLARCRLQVASWEKRFIRDLCGLPSDAELTERQAQALEQVRYKYRKQLGEPDLPKPPTMKPSKRMQRAIDKQLQQLRQWNGEVKQ